MSKKPKPYDYEASIHAALKAGVDLLPQDALLGMYETGVRTGVERERAERARLLAEAEMKANMKASKMYTQGREQGDYEGYRRGYDDGYQQKVDEQAFEEGLDA
jgi:flagellar biosynthesis/type III secretory pathway protein FliH